MAFRRVAYGAAVLAALAFQIFYDGYLAQFLLVCVLALPLLSLLLSLPGLLALRLTLSSTAPRLIRGQSGQWKLGAHNALPFPVARLSLELATGNLLTGAALGQRFRITGLSGGQTRALPMDCSHCGALTGQIRRAKGLDYLGLFAFPLSPPPRLQALVLPAPAPMEDLPGLDQLWAQVGAVLGRAQSGEDYEIRDYRPGDPIRSIHWKLSSKYDQPVVREPLKNDRPQVVLSFDLFGDPDRLDRVLARLWTASTFLLEREISHELRWTAPGGRLCTAAVASMAQLTDSLAQILSQPAPAQCPPPAAIPQDPRLAHLHITGGEEEDTP